WDERPWSFISWGAVRSLPGPGGWPRLDAIRRRALAELVAFDRRVRGEGSADARSIGAALFELLTALAVPERLAAWRDEAERAGDVTAAREHGQVWDALVGLLDEMAEALGGEPLTVHDYREIFEAGLDGLRIGLIPPALDQVLVGAIDRSRQPDLRAVLLLGLNEGVFPAAPGEDPILDDEDRRRLARAGYELAADSRRRLYRERYLAYIALTRPRERLWLSYSTGAPGGGQRLPSPIIQRLRALFRDLDEVRVSPVDGRPAEIQHPQRLMGALLRHLRWRGPAAADPAWLKAQRWLARHPRHGPRLRRLLPALEEPRPVRALSSEVRAALYRDRQLSVSRLERQAICPFWRFAAHDLRLEPDPSGQPDALSLGAWLHEALRAIGEHVAAAGRDWASLEPDEQQRLVARALAPLRTWLDEGRLSASARTGYLLTRLERTLRWTVGLLVEHARRSEFRPVAHELAFGEAGGLPPLILASDAGPVALRGRIDRVDVAEVAGQTWLRVIDYKSGRRSLPLADVYHGLALQLPLYLAVAVAGAPQWLGRPAQPAGAYYLPLAEPIVDDPGDGDKADRRRLAAAKLAGLTVRDAAVIRAMDRRIAGWSEIVQAGLSDRTGEPFQDDRVAPLPDLEALLAFARARAAQLAGAILAGRVAAHPYRRADGSVPCGSCPFGSVCRFEGRFGWHRELPSLGPDDVWQRVRAGRQQEAGDLPRPLPGGDDR
ncbi:MAG TPA: PD-(D/E)XK nuclease family protein, partial [Bacillota bacterium]